VNNNNIFVHLGLAKTASTFLQQGIFSKHSEINYLGKNLVATELHKAGHRLVRNKPEQYNDSEVKRQFRRAIRQGEDKKVHVYSEEDLSVFKFLDPNVCARRLQRIFTNYNAFLFIREPLSWINSQYYFLLSTYRIDTLDGFMPWLTKHFQNLGVGSDIAEIEYSKIINIYEKKLGNGLFKVYLYEEFRENPKYVLQSIGDFMGIDQDELMYLNDQRSQQVKDKERMTIAMVDFIKNANFLVKDEFDYFRKNLEKYLSLIPNKKKFGSSDLSQQIEKLFSDKTTDIEIWKPCLHRVSRLLKDYFASSPKAEEEISNYLKEKILKISIKQNKKILDHWQLPLEHYGYLLPKKYFSFENNDKVFTENKSINKTKNTPISTQVSFSLRTEKLIDILKTRGTINYCELASSLRQDGLLSKDEAIAMERKGTLPKWLLEELSKDRKNIFIKEVRESEQIRKIDITFCPSETIKVQPPQRLYDGPVPETLTAKFAKSPLTNVIEVKNGKFWLENFQKIILLDEQNYYNWDSTANASWLPPILSSLKPEHFVGKVAVMIAPGASLFSHWLFDLMPKFQLLFAGGYQIDDIDYFLINKQKNSYHLEILEKLGIPKNKIVYQTPKLNFISADTLIVPSKIRNGFYTPQWAINFMRNLLLDGQKNIITSPKHKFYLSRGKAKRRRIINENDLTTVLEKFNYQTVYAEDYGISDFASLICQASSFVSPHGAGLSNILFCRPLTPVLEIFGPHISSEYWLLSQSCNLKYHILAGQDQQGLFPWQEGAFPYENFQQKNGYDFFVEPQNLENALAAIENLII
jgi:hypothetical protein